MPTFKGNTNQKKMKRYIHNNNFTIYPRQQVATSCLCFSGRLKLKRVITSHLKFVMKYCEHSITHKKSH